MAVPNAFERAQMSKIAEARLNAIKRVEDEERRVRIEAIARIEAEQKRRDAERKSQAFQCPEAVVQDRKPKKSLFKAIFCINFESESRTGRVYNPIGLDNRRTIISQSPGFE